MGGSIHAMISKGSGNHLRLAGSWARLKINAIKTKHWKKYCNDTFLYFCVEMYLLDIRLDVGGSRQAISE